MTVREIRFRGRRADNGEWVYGLPAYNRDCTGIDKIGEIMASGEICRLVDPETVGQYTGLDSWDETNSELFRGDIVSLVDEDNETYIAYIDIEGPLVLLVSDRFDDGYELASEFMESLDGQYWIPGAKKIGNRWDHPHLLKGE